MLIDLCYQLAKGWSWIKPVLRGLVPLEFTAAVQRSSNSTVQACASAATTGEGRGCDKEVVVVVVVGEGGT